jgi:hypothetical protein
MIVDMNWLRKIPRRFHSAASFACSGVRAMRDYLKKGKANPYWGFPPTNTASAGQSLEDIS